MSRLQGFQSTLPRRERQIQAPARAEYVNFNPRSRVGSDNMALGMGVGFEKFQSTLPRRERLKQGRDDMGMTAISIHAPA